MAYKQPKIPPFHEGAKLAEYIRELILFLKDFCAETWTAVVRLQKKVYGGEDESIDADSLGGIAAEEYLLKSGTAADSKKFCGMTFAQMMLTLYPVGSIYMSADSTSPASLFGGTWEQIKDTFLLAAGDTYAVGSTGGEAKVTLTVSQIPSHTHYSNQIFFANHVTENLTSYYAAMRGDDLNPSNSSTSRNRVSYAGSGQSHNNMPPYRTVYVWQRIE